MKKYHLTILATVLSLYLLGCNENDSLQIVRTDHLQTLQTANAIDPNDKSYHLVDVSQEMPHPQSLDQLITGTQTTSLQHIQPKNHTIKQANRSVLPFALSRGGRPSVTATLTPNTSRNVILDTGCPYMISMKTSDTAKLNFSVYKTMKSDIFGNTCGFCFVPNLTLGSTHILDSLAFCKETSRKLSSNTQAQETHHNDILLGLAILKDFKFIQFNTLTQEVTFSLHDSFKWNSDDTWKTYDFSIKNKRGLAIMTRMKMGNHVQELMFDTGSGVSLIMKERLWREIAGKAPINSLKPVDLWATSHFGKTTARHGRFNFKIGNNGIYKTDICVVANGIPLRDCDGIFGLNLFKNANVVIDFEQSCLRIQWIKKQNNKSLPALAFNTQN